MRRRRFLATIIVAMAATASAWPGSHRAAAAPTPVRVLYAGSLVNVFERDLGPAFTRASGIAVLGRAGGSTALAHMIRDGLVPADVFVSAEPGVNRILAPQAGAPSANWYLTFGTTSMVIAYAPGSRFAPALRIGPWFQVLASPGLRLGRTDPALDPKGFRTILVAQLAETYYHEPGLARRLLGPDENPSQIFPEEALVGRLTSGQADAGFFYLVETVAEHLPYVTLPPALNLSDPEFAATYATVSWVDSSGAKHTGAPIVYTVTIPSSARNPDGAARFVAFLLGREARALLASRGILGVPVRAGGRPSDVPPRLRPLVTGPFQP
ncbi:MAG TPA: extracellular solute-binding protein [bacterium]|nr:extracellular solute-binding protein [bacterium]